MSQFGDDCHYFYNSSCVRGNLCPYRHSEAAKLATVTCTYWKQNKCSVPNCPFRHAGVKVGQPQRVRDEMPCFWEGQSGVCTRPNCMYKHLIPRPGVNVQPIVRPRNPASTGIPRVAASNIITLVDTTADVRPPQLPPTHPHATKPPYPVYMPDTSVPPPDMPGIGIGPVIKPVIVNTADDSSDVESPYNSPIKKPIERKDVAPNRVIRDLTRVEDEKPVEVSDSKLKQKSDVDVKPGNETKEESNSQTNQDSGTVQKKTAAVKSKPKTPVTKSSKQIDNGKPLVGSNNKPNIQDSKPGSSRSAKKIILTKKPRAVGVAKPLDTSKSRDKRISMNKPNSCKKSPMGQVKIRPSPDAEKKRRPSVTGGRTPSGGFRRRSESEKQKRLDIVTAKPKIISLKKKTKEPEKEEKEKASDSDEDLGIKSLEQTLRERALKSMGIIELKSGRIVRTNVKKRRSTDKKEAVLMKKRKEDERKKEEEQKRKKKVAIKKKELSSEEELEDSEVEEKQSSEEDENESEVESSDKNGTDAEEDKQSEEEDEDLEEEEEIELGEENPEDMVSKESEKEDSEEEQEESEQEEVESEQASSEEEEEVPTPVKKKKTIVIATDTRKAVIKKGKSSLENFTIKRTVPVQPTEKKKTVKDITIRKAVINPTEVTEEKPKRKRRVILEDDESDMKPVSIAPVISVVKPSIKNRLGIVLKYPDKHQKSDDKRSPEPPKVEQPAPKLKQPVEVKVAPTAVNIKPKSSNIWSRRAWNSREDKTEGIVKPSLGGIRSRLGQTEENTEPANKKRLGWRKAGSTNQLKDDKTELGDVEREEIDSTSSGNAKKVRRQMQIYVPPALKRVAAEPVADDEPPSVKRQTLSSSVKENIQKPEKKESVKTFAQIMAEKRERQKQLKESSVTKGESPPPKKVFIPIRFDVEGDDTDSAPAASLTDSVSSSSPATVSDTNIKRKNSKQSADKLSRWKKKSHVKKDSKHHTHPPKVKNAEISSSSSSSYNQDFDHSTNITSSSLIISSGPLASKSNQDSASTPENVTQTHDSSQSLSVTQQENIVSSLAEVTVLPPGGNTGLEAENKTVSPSSQEIKEEQEEETIVPAKRVEHSSSDNWLDLDVDDLDLDINVSSGETKDEDLLREIDELLA